MEIHAIVAIDKNGAIGKEGKLPWHIPSELKHFKATTMGFPMVLGRKTYEGFKNPLPGRDHLVLSGQKLLLPQNHVYVFSHKEELLNFCSQKKYQKIFICGGQSIYQLFDAEITTWHISEIHCAIDKADSYLKNDYQKNFRCHSTLDFCDEKTQQNWTYKTYLRAIK